MNYSKLFSVFALLALSANAYPQCQGFQKTRYCHVQESADFNYYSLSKSATVIIGEMYKCQVFLFGQKDYIFSLCAEQGFKPVHFRIVDSKTDELIYDNIQDNYNQIIGFSVEKNQTVNVEVTVLSKKKNTADPDQNRICIGIQILWRRIPKIGFK
jgi:hypothetical protein